MSVTELNSDVLLHDVPVHEGYKVLGGVVLYEKLGRGGMGAVYKGRHARLGIDVAVKIMALPPALASEEVENFVHRFIREARTAALINHTNLVRVMDVNSEHGIHYLVMDYVDGESAGQRLKRKGNLSEEESLEICLGAAEGLGAAHRKGIVHRDVKPDNIMIDKDGCVRVADLGLAKVFTDDTNQTAPSMLTQTQTAMGTPHYMSPEQFMSTRSVGPAADVWSLGVTLYELLTASVPWSDSSVYAVAFKVTNDPLPDPRNMSPGLSEGACSVLEKALSKAPEERYADCGEMARAISAHLGSMQRDGNSTLPDARAGTTNVSLMSLTPPASQTMTLIGAALGAKPVSVASEAKTAQPQSPPPEGATPATIVASSPAGRRWILPVAIAGGALALAVLLLALFMERRDPLDAEAERFYTRLAESFAVGNVEEVNKAIRAAAGKYDGTTFGAKIVRFGQNVAAALTEREAREEDAKKGLLEAKRRAEREAELRRVALEVALKKADESEDPADLEAAVRTLRAALESSDDAGLRERLANLERRVECLRLAAEADGHEKSGRLADASTAYDAAIALARPAGKAALAERLAAVKRRIAAERAVSEAEALVDVGRWGKAWDRVERARRDGISDARLGKLGSRAVKALAPPPSHVGPVGIEFVLVPGGTFEMGSAGGKAMKKPVLSVTVTSFYIGRTEVTRAQFEDPADSGGKDRALPAVGMSWRQAVDFCAGLSRSDKSGASYRLPTEAEWEYAARGTEGRLYPWSNTLADPPQANLVGDADGFGGPAPVGSFPRGATPLGILDMAGNAAEWCSDWYGLYRAGQLINPVGPMSGRARVVRGGAFRFGLDFARGSARAGRRSADPSDCIGFRVVRELTFDEKRFEKLARALPR